MQLVLRITAFVVTTGLIAVSLMMNFRFGQSLGRTEWDGLVYGLASLCADGFKVVLPFAIAQAWQARRWLATAVGAALWLAFTTYSMTSSLGHSAVNRSEVSGARQMAISGYADIRQSLAAKQKERAALATVRPGDTIEADLKALELKPLWRWSKSCADAGNRDLRQFCEGVLRLQGELATARRSATLDAEIAALTEKGAGLSMTSAGSEADPQVAILRDLTGIGGDRVRIGLTILVSLMVELGSSLGLFVLVGHKVKTESSPASRVEPDEIAVRDQPAMTTSSEVLWREARLMERADAYASEMDIYRDYCIWIVRHDRGPALTLSAFRIYLAREAVGQPIRKAGRTFYAGIGLRAEAIADGRRVEQVA